MPAAARRAYSSSMLRAALNSAASLCPTACLLSRTDACSCRACAPRGIDDLQRVLGLHVAAPGSMLVRPHENQAALVRLLRRLACDIGNRERKITPLRRVQ